MGKSVKRKSQVVTTSSKEIPFDRVRVEWIDCVSDSGWADEKEFDKMRLATPINEGWLYKKNKSSLNFLQVMIKRMTVA